MQYYSELSAVLQRVAVLCVYLSSSVRVAVCCYRQAVLQ